MLKDMKKHRLMAETLRGIFQRITSTFPRLVHCDLMAYSCIVTRLGTDIIKALLYVTYNSVLNPIITETSVLEYHATPLLARDMSYEQTDEVASFHQICQYRFNGTGTLRCLLNQLLFMITECFLP